LAEALEISINVIGSEAFEGRSLLVQVGEEVLDVPPSILARFRGQSPLLRLGLEEIFEPRMIATGRGRRIVCQTAKPFQKAAGNGTEVLLGPARSGGPSLSHSSRCPRSGDGLELCGFEAMFSGILLDLPGDG